jgi:hypothetical protein
LVERWCYLDFAYVSHNSVIVPIVSLGCLSQPDETEFSRVRNSRRGHGPAVRTEILVVRFHINFFPANSHPPMISESNLPMMLNLPLYQTQPSTFDRSIDWLFSTPDQLTVLTNFLKFHCDRTTFVPKGDNSHAFQGTADQRHCQFEDHVLVSWIMGLIMDWKMYDSNSLLMLYMHDTYTKAHGCSPNERHSQKP